MSFGSSNSREVVDPNDLFKDEDLDYEPYDKENPVDQDPEDQEPPDKSNQDFEVSFSGSSKQAIPPQPKTVLTNFRDQINYLKLQSDIDKDSFRSGYSDLGKICNSFSLLDSSDDESNPDIEDYDQYSDDSFEENEDKSYGSSYDPEMPDNTLLSSSNNYSYPPICDSNQNISNKPKRAVFNFTIKVSGNDRLCIGIPPPLPKKKPQKPWLTTRGLDLRRVVVMKCPEQLKYVPVEDDINLSDTEGTKSASTRLSSGIPSASIHSTSIHSTSSSAFKMPLKRPPTRVKSKNLSVCLDTTLGTKMVQEKLNPGEPEEDIISLIASTNIGEEEDVIAGGEAELKSEPTSLSEGAKLDRVAQWVENEVQNQRPEVPNVLKGLCFKHFFYNSCRNTFCRHGHVLPRFKINQIFNLSQPELDETFEFSTTRPILFNKIYPIFAEVYASKGSKEDLLKILKLIFYENSTMAIQDQVQGLRIVLENLKKIDDSSFEDAVDFVLLEVGIRPFQLLGEALLEVIIGMNNIPTHWPIIRRLIVAGTKIPNRLANRFLMNLMQSPVDFEVCREVYQHILKYMCLDLPAVPAEMRDNFLTVSRQKDVEERFIVDPQLEANIDQNLSRERHNFEHNNQLRVQTFSTSREKQKQHFRGPVVIQGSIGSASESLNVAPPLFITDTGNGSDFASLSRLTQANNHLDHLDACIAKNTALFQEPRKITSTSNKRKYLSSTDDEADDLEGSTGSSSHPAAITIPPLVYNSSGLRYDPLKDYGPAHKRRKRAEEEECSDSAFDRLRWGGNPKEDDGLSWGETVPSYNEVRQNNSNYRRAQSNANCLNLVSNSRDFVAPAAQVAPDQPCFGRFHLNPNYELNVSLHNFYTDKIDNVNINEEDVFVLNDCIKFGEGKVFLDLVTKYNGPVTVQNFISMVLANLKGLNQLVGRTYKKLLDSIEKYQSSLYANLKLRVILEVITMNLLFELEKRNMFDYARDLLTRFSDWDSLITSRLFITDISTGVSLVGRYLFIAKMLVYTKPELTFEILVCPALHLLEDYSKWPYHPSSPSSNVFNADLESRNLVLDKFFQIGYLHNVVIVIELYKKALRTKEGIWSFDVSKYVDPMVVKLINVKKIVFLKQILPELHLFIEYLEKDTLRACICLMGRHLSKKDVFRLYEQCMLKGVYQQIYQGQYLVNTVEIRTDMLPVELDLIIVYYFHKLRQEGLLPFGSESLHFEIKLPGNLKTTSKIPLLNTNRSIFEIKQKIEHVLKMKCGLDCKTISPHVLLVERESLISFSGDPSSTDATSTA